MSECNIYLGKQRFGSKCNVFRQTLSFLRGTQIFFKFRKRFTSRRSFWEESHKYLPSNEKFTNAMFYEIVKVLRTKAKFLGEDRIQKRVNATFLWNHTFFANKCRFSGEYNFYLILGIFLAECKNVASKCKVSTETVNTFCVKIQCFLGECKRFANERSIYVAMQDVARKYTVSQGNIKDFASKRNASRGTKKFSQQIRFSKELIRFAGEHDPSLEMHDVCQHMQSFSESSRK